MMRSDMDEEAPTANEGFGSRWSRRKLDAQKQHQDLSSEPQTDTSGDIPVLTDADMPPIESLTEDSDYSGFLSPEVSDELRKQALRKLFQGGGFNVCDGLDDYDEDFTSFAKLGDIITADMRHQMEVEARNQLALTEAESSGEESINHQQDPQQEQNEYAIVADQNHEEYLLSDSRSLDELEDEPVEDEP
jgi:hypothetical protein